MNVFIFHPDNFVGRDEEVDTCSLVEACVDVTVMILPELFMIVQMLGFPSRSSYIEIEICTSNESVFLECRIYVGIL